MATGPQYEITIFHAIRVSTINEQDTCYNTLSRILPSANHEGTPFYTFVAIISFSDRIFCLKNTFSKRIQPLLGLGWFASRREENMVLVDMGSIGDI